MRRMILAVLFGAGLVTAAGVLTHAGQEPAAPLGLPPVPIPKDNPQTPEKIALGDRLFHDTRFSATGEVSCATCHDDGKAFTDSPLKTSEGIEKKTGTRNAPTVVNAAYFSSQFWDGRSPSLEDQALHPFVNPVEMGLADHQPILDIVRTDPGYAKAFADIFGVSGEMITMDEVTKAIAAFERTLVAGDSAFDRWYFGGDQGALTKQQARGFDLFINQGRCVSCHIVEQTQALFTDNRFHNIGVGINNIQEDVPELAGEFLEADLTLSEVDIEVLSDARTSELGRFAISHDFDDLGSFKTPTLRNIAATAPYMHDGSVATLRDAIVHYNNGGVTNEGDPVNDFLSGGIRPLNLEDEQIDDLVAFMEALTSPRYAEAAAESAGGEKRRQP
ncbi:MAG: cytochrome-c peroxidase [Thermoanaerobaculales bacterium]